MNNGTDWYIANTPVSLLVACAVACHDADRPKNSLLFVYEDFLDADTYRTEVLKWKQNPFSEVVLINGAYSTLADGIQSQGRGLSDSRRRNLMRSETNKLFEAYLEKFPAARICFSADNNVTTQYAIYRARKRYGDVPFVYLDNGMHSYVPGLKRMGPFSIAFDVWRRRLTYGMWYDYNPIPGGSHHTSAARVVWPEHYRGRNRFKDGEVQPIPREWLTSRQYCALARALAERFELKAEDYRDCKFFFLLSHSRVVSHIPGFEQALRDFLANCAQEGIPVAVKYHPREDGDFLNVAQYPTVRQVPLGASFELIFSLLPPNQPLVLVSTASSILATAKLIRPDSRPLCLTLTDNPRMEPTLEFFKKLGIPLIHSLDELQAQLQD